MKGDTTMKERYEKPETEIIIFETEDVITASGLDNELPFDPLLMDDEK